MRLEDLAPRPGDILLAGSEKIAPRSSPKPQKPVLNQVHFPVRTRRYDAAVPSNTTADWQAWATSANYEIYTAWRRTCYLARDLERNNPHAKAFLRELCSNVLGATGIQIRPKMRMLRGGELNDPLNSNIKKAWLDWRRRGNFDVSGLISGYKADKLILRTLARDGEVIIRLIRGYPNKYRLAIQILEADVLDLWYNALLDPNTGRRVTMGVEVDRWGKPLNYHLLKYNQQDLFATNTTMKRMTVPANEIIHIFVHERPTQCRGITWFTPVETKLRMLERYEEATAIAMRISAAKMGFLTQEKDAQQYDGQGQLPTGELLEEVAPGEVIKLPPGMNFESFDPTNPSENYSAFRKSSLRSISSGLGIMYNNLANDLESTNYSSSRYGRSIEIETWRDLQRFLAEDYLQMLFDPFIDQATLTEAIPGVSQENADTVKTSVLWKPRGWAYVDPDKDGKSAANGIDMGLTTRRIELEEQGLDIDEVYEELAEDKKRQAKYGLTFVNAWSRQPEVQSTEEDPNAPGAEVVGPAGGNGSAKKNGTGKTTAATPNRK
jgi:lambda family phage portal protein